jgi:predicted amidophosphoribosyltransferase
VTNLACANCGAAAIPGQRFCGQCGQPLPQEPAAGDEPLAAAAIDRARTLAEGFRSPPLRARIDEAVRRGPHATIAEDLPN